MTDKRDLTLSQRSGSVRSSGWSPILLLVAALPIACEVQVSAKTEPFQSPRLERAKDLIAEEQWERAIEQFEAASVDAKERNRDEALFWLAHSQHQARDLAAAVQTISRLEQQYPASRWVKPARSLRIEIAQKLHRHDVLWWTAAPPSPASPATPPPAPVPATPPTRSGRPPLPAPRPPLTPRPVLVPPASPAQTPQPVGPMDPPAAFPEVRSFASPRRVLEPMPSTVWIPKGWHPDTSLRIQALGSLIQTDAQRVIPILRDIAFGSPNASEASRAIFLLAQSGRPDARSTVVEVAKRGSESAQIAAVRELGRFASPNAAAELLQVYATGNPRVKDQVVHSLGERSATKALLRIVETERDMRLQETAIVRLGQAGAREQLARLYSRAPADLKRAIIAGLFNARGEAELIRIAEQEQDPDIRDSVLTRLRLLGTEPARAYLEKQRQNR